MSPVKILTMFVIILAVFFQGRLTLAAIDIAVAGTSKTFRCAIPHSTGDVTWDRINVRSATREVIFNGETLAPEFESRVRVSTSGLTIGVLSPDDAGTYECIDRTTAETIMSWTLAVLMDSNLRCVIDNQNGKIDVICSICYVGEFPAPNTTCTSHVAGHAINSMTTTTTNSCVEYRQRFQADRNIHGSVLTCKSIFVYNEQVYHTYEWTSGTLNITYGPSSVHISPSNQTRFRHGDNMTCTADGNPTPTYSWILRETAHAGPVFGLNICGLAKNADGKTVLQQQQQQQRQGGSGSSLSSAFELTCIAFSGNRSSRASIFIEIVADDEDMKLCETEQQTVLEQSSWSWKQMTLIGVGALAGVFLLLVVALQVRFVRFKSYTDKLYVQPGARERTRPMSVTGTIIYDDLNGPAWNPQIVADADVTGLQATVASDNQCMSDEVASDDAHDVMF